MREFFPTDDDFDVNYTSDVKKCEVHYASLGMFHCFVGSTGPGIYVMPDKSVVVGNYPDKVWNAETEEDIEVPCPEKDFKVGEVVTDLWWFSACDHDDFLKRGGVVGKVGWVPDVVVEMPEGPGRYRLTSYFSVQRNREQYGAYAVIRKVP
jgi:hypothetical protein